MPRVRKRFGQHFLTPEWTRKVVQAVAPAPDDRFLEIGPGHGALTLPLAAVCARVVAIEIDRDLAAGLRARAPENVTVIEGDVLRLDLPSILRAEGVPPPVRAAGNLPYNISSPILVRLLREERAADLFSDATLMLQREVAQRVGASPGTKDYGVLSVLVQLQSEVTPLLTLPPGAFRPAPKVWSSVIRLRFHPPSPAIGDIAGFERLVKGLFAQRRKTVLNALKSMLGDAAAARRALERANIDPRRRPETLDLPELAALAEVPGSVAG